MKKFSSSLILPRGTEFNGRLSFKKSGRICGIFKGEILAPEGILIIEPGARVEAKVRVQEMAVKGWMQGEVEASHSITLFAGSEFYGILNTNKLHIEESAIFEGQVIKSSGV